jgi:hypothetical protein
LKLTLALASCGFAAAVGVDMTVQRRRKKLVNGFKRGSEGELEVF